MIAKEIQGFLVWSKIVIFL